MDVNLINDTNWHDSSLDSIEIVYNECRVTFFDFCDMKREILTKSFHSIHYVGQYDENVIYDIDFNESSTLIDDTQEIIQNNYKYHDTNLRELVIKLIDNVQIRIVADDFHLEKI